MCSALRDSGTHVFLENVIRVTKYGCVNLIMNFKKHCDLQSTSKSNPKSLFQPLHLILWSAITAVIAKWLAGQTAVLTALVRDPHECKVSVQCKAIALPAFYDVITGPTEFIIFIINLAKMVNMPYSWLPLLKDGNSLGILLLLLLLYIWYKLNAKI